MKAEELIQNLRTNLEESGSQLMNTTDQHLMYMLDEARSVLAKRKMDAFKSVDMMTQFVDVTPVIAPVSELGEIGTTRVLKLPIPDPIEYNNGSAIFTVGATDGQDSYSKITYSELRTVLFRKYTSETPKWLWLHNHIYIINAEIDSRSKVRVRGIFQEPYKVIQARGEYKFLDPFNWNYPLTNTDADAVYKLAMAGDLGWGDSAIQAINSANKKEERADAIASALNKQ